MPPSVARPMCRAKRPVLTAPHARQVCTRVRFNHTCGSPDQEPDIVQRPSLGIPDHAGPCGTPHSRRCTTSGTRNRTRW